MAYQGFRRRAFCQIKVDGKDVTANFDPHLISVQVLDHEGNHSDTCSIELDDRDGQLAIPPDQASVEISLGWTNEQLGVVFTGKVDEVESGFARRGGGRRLWIEAKSFDLAGAGRSHFLNAWGDGADKDIPVKDVFEKAAKDAGYQMKISPSMQEIKRKYWSQQNESFHHFGTRLAKELGGTFKISGDIATFVNATDGKNVDGDSMPQVDAIWGENLISWRIKPFVAAPQAAKASSNHFDKLLGIWGEVSKEIGGEAPFGRSNAVAGGSAPAPNSQVAEQGNEGMSQSSIGKRGTGSVVINGEPSAHAGGSVRIKGARPGVDGQYTIVEAEHHYSRSGGYITRLGLKNPRFSAETILKYEEWGFLKKGQEAQKQPAQEQPAQELEVQAPEQSQEEELVP